MFLVYSGPHLEVEVPHDEVTGGSVYAERGKAVEVPDSIVDDLLAQGEESVDQIPVDADGRPTREPQHARTWRKATAAEIKKAGSGSDAPATADDREDGDQA